MTVHMATGVPQRRDGYCSHCGKAILPPKDRKGRWRRTCGPECLSAVYSSHLSAGCARQRAQRAERVARHEREHLAKGLPLPKCTVCRKPISPAFTTEGKLRERCSRSCAMAHRGALERVARAKARNYALEQEAALRKSVTNRQVMVYRDPNHKPQRVCDTCCDLPHRRHEAHGCPECGLPYQEERVTSIRQNVSAIALAARWA